VFLSYGRGSTGRAVTPPAAPASQFNEDGRRKRRGDLPPQDKRKIVEALIEKIVIGNGEIDITFSHLPSSEELCKNQQRLGLG
jgi:hypothetical protein